MSAERWGRDQGAVPVVLVAVLGGLAVLGAGAGFGAQRLLVDDEPTFQRAVVRGPVALYDCPGGAEVATLHGGDRVFITARGDDGWLRLRNPSDPNGQWWVDGARLAPDTSIDELPLVDCFGSGQSDTALDGPAELAAGETTTTVEDEAAGTATTDAVPDSTVATPPGQPTTTSGGPPPSAPSTTGPPTTPPPPPADTTGPALSVSVSPTGIWELNGGGISCGADPRQATLTANVSDPSGVSLVRATWS
jgi:hypothetical protein